MGTDIMAGYLLWKLPNCFINTHWHGACIYGSVRSQGRTSDIAKKRLVSNGK